MAAPVEASVQGKLKRNIPFAGTPQEDFKGWQKAITAYLQEWCVDYHLRQSSPMLPIPQGQQDWTELQKYNHRCVFNYLTSVLSGQARMIVLSEEVGGDVKRAWDALANEYDRRTDMEIEVTLNE